MKLLWTLPYKWGLGGLSLVVVAIAFFFGLGQRVSDRSHESALVRERPAALQVARETDALTHPLPAVRALVRQALSDRPAEGPVTAAAFETSRLHAAAPKFSIEASMPLGSLVEAHAWLVHLADGGATQTLLPVQQGPQAARAFVAGAEPEDYFVIVLIFRTLHPVERDMLSTAVTLRVLD